MSGTEVQWYQCLDEGTGYCYFWNATTNEVLWELPEGVPFAPYSADGTSAAPAASTTQVCVWGRWDREWPSAPRS